MICYTEDSDEQQKKLIHELSANTGIKSHLSEHLPAGLARKEKQIGSGC